MSTAADKRPWVSVRARPRGGAAAVEAVVAALFAAGSQGVQEQGDAVLTQFPPDTDVETLRAALLAADPTADVAISLTAPVDWTEGWKALIGAHDLGGLAVVPPWLAEGRDPAATIVIDPGMAFGTGDHPTTRGVVRLMQGVVRPGDVVADLGAGSAVLSIAAVKLGAARCAAIEFDPDAIANAEENVARNGATGRVTVIEGDARVLLPLVAPVRLVLANIISSILLELMDAIDAALAPDGEAILSGILWDERETMLRAIEAHGWRAVAEDHEDVWWSVRCARRAN
ncbi:50S ribosomal protein L11 methyltransferase [Roseisolibacter sp. H3M3-2]|uniref:50S ribosomal protein L11 methyltransferase n=1 Tax=Roseisolibacter sp. H3M3-2 TaxID=3031323 RepID=UPI0023DA1B7C|nr:50S ribosomal protein L11 methyltransferase [Roseisolibacter sp. H3M3-2]MDF1502200.1 50S ribosomal protein L11 methyltransferase [Roseisolibacter sp. H3M3-2]